MLLKKVSDFWNLLFGVKKEKIDKICSVEFFINDKKEYNFLCNWAEVEGLDTAKFFAKLLFAINSGYFNDSIAQTLVANINNNKEKEFIDDVIFTWGLMNKEWDNAIKKDNTESPMVKPSQAFIKLSN